MEITLGIAGLIVLILIWRRVRNQRSVKQALIYADSLEQFSRCCYSDFRLLLWQLHDPDRYLDLDLLNYKSAEFNKLDYLGVHSIDEELDEIYNSLITDSNSCDQRIKEYYIKTYTDPIDAYKMEVQRLAFYGLEALEVARHIRVACKTPTNDMYDIESAFRTFLDQENRKFIVMKNEGLCLDDSFIFELLTGFSEDK